MQSVQDIECSSSSEEGSVVGARFWEERASPSSPPAHLWRSLTSKYYMVATSSRADQLSGRHDAMHNTGCHAHFSDRIIFDGAWWFVVALGIDDKNLESRDSVFPIPGSHDPLGGLASSGLPRAQLVHAAACSTPSLALRPSQPLKVRPLSRRTVPLHLRPLFSARSTE